MICVEVSFMIYKMINHIIERGDKGPCMLFGCFKKAFDTIWIDGLFKLFFDLSTGSNFWLILQDLYSDIHAKVLYGGGYYRPFKLLQGCG